MVIIHSHMCLNFPRGCNHFEAANMWTGRLGLLEDGAYQSILEARRGSPAWRDGPMVAASVWPRGPRGNSSGPLGPRVSPAGESITHMSNQSPPRADFSQQDPRSLGLLYLRNEGAKANRKIVYSTSNVCSVHSSTIGDLAIGSWVPAQCNEGWSLLHYSSACTHGVPR